MQSGTSAQFGPASPIQKNWHLEGLIQAANEEATVKLQSGIEHLFKNQVMYVSEAPRYSKCSLRPSYSMQTCNCQSFFLFFFNVFKVQLRDVNIHQNTASTSNQISNQISKCSQRLNVALTISLRWRYWRKGNTATWILIFLNTALEWGH